MGDGEHADASTPIALSNFNPNQARDAHGRWSYVHGDSLAKYTNEKGEWTAERQKLHDEIVSKYLAQAKTKPIEPVYVIFGGGSAAGKSNLAKHLGSSVLPKDKVHVDTDEIKGMLPDYKDMQNAGDSRAAAYTHEESSYLGKRIVKEALKEGFNVILDGTGNVSLESLQQKAAQARQAGHKVHGVYATVPTKMAEDRNLARAQKTGRLVVPTYLRSTHKAVSSIVPAAMANDTFDDFGLYDTQNGVRLIASKQKGFPQVIHDNDLYQQFLDKAKE
jgi:predicted kinase